MVINVDHHERSVNQDSVNRDTFSLHDQNGETLRRVVSAKSNRPSKRKFPIAVVLVRSVQLVDKNHLQKPLEHKLGSQQFV